MTHCSLSATDKLFSTQKVGGVRNKSLIGVSALPIPKGWFQLPEVGRH